jgi:hypothetical protein
VRVPRRRFAGGWGVPGLSPGFPAEPVLSFSPARLFSFQRPGKCKSFFTPGLTGQSEKVEGLGKIRPPDQAQGEPSQRPKFAKGALVSEELGRRFPGMAGE